MGLDDKLARLDFVSIFDLSLSMQPTYYGMRFVEVCEIKLELQMYKSVYDRKGFVTVPSYGLNSYEALDYRKAEEEKYSTILNFVDDGFALEKDLKNLALKVDHFRSAAHALAKHNLAYTKAHSSTNRP